MIRHQIVLLSGIVAGMGCDKPLQEDVVPDDDTNASDDDTTASDDDTTASDDDTTASDDDTNASDDDTSPPLLDLQASLEHRVGLNGGRGGGVARVQNKEGVVLFEGVSGNAWVDGPAMAPEDTFEVASITKTFTAAAILLQEEEGLLGLDAPISTWLDSSWTEGLLVISGHDHGPELTPRQLLQHRSGLPDYWSDPPFTGGPGVNAFLEAFMADSEHLWSPEELLAYVRGLNPIAAPDVQFHYSDSGFVLLGVLAETLDGQPLHDIFRTRLLNPLGLDHTWLTWHEEPASEAVLDHRYEGSLDLHGRVHQSADWAGGGLVSSTGDLIRFMEALEGGEVFAYPSTLAAMKSWLPTGWEDVGYGLGVFQVDLGELGELWGHDGYGNSWMYTWPDRGVTLVGTLNQTDNDWWPWMEEAILQIDEAGL